MWFAARHSRRAPSELSDPRKTLMLSLSKVARTLVLGLVIAALTVPARAADLDKLAPADAEAALVINVKAYLESSLYKKYSEEQTKKALTNGPAAKFVEVSGFDPLKDLESITVTFANVTGKDEMKACVIAKGKLDLPKLQKAIKDAAKQTGDLLKITTEGDQTYYVLTPPVGPSISGTFIGDDTLVVSNNADYLKDIVKGKEIEATAGAKVLKTALGKVAAKQTIAVAAALTAELKQKLGENESIKDTVEKIDSVTGAINIGESMDIVLTVNTSDLATAKNLGLVIKQAIPLLKVLSAANEEASPLADLVVDNVKVTWEGKVVYLRAQFAEDALIGARERSQKAQVKNRLADGDKALKAMKFREAERFFFIVTRIDPDNEDGKKGLAKTKALSAGYQALTDKKWSDAEAAFGEALKIDPANDLAKEGLAKAKAKKE